MVPIMSYLELIVYIAHPTIVIVVQLQLIQLIPVCFVKLDNILIRQINVFLACILQILINLLVESIA